MKSNFEENFAADLKRRKIEFEYEATRFHYSIPKSYRPDFKIGDMYIETKGYHPGFKKYLSDFLHFKAQNPDVDIRFVFDKGIPQKKIGTKMTVAAWADRHNIKWSEATLPKEWLK